MDQLGARVDVKRWRLVKWPGELPAIGEFAVPLEVREWEDGKLTVYTPQDESWWRAVIAALAECWNVGVPRTLDPGPLILDPMTKE